MSQEQPAQPDSPNPDAGPPPVRNQSRSRLDLSHVLCRPSMFRFWQKFGVHVTPVHFYQPIPDTRSLREELWGDVEQPAGIDMRHESQLALLDRMHERYVDEWRQLRNASADGGFRLGNGRFESVDAEVYYGLIRERMPRRIIEIGSGHSTLLALKAIAAAKASDPSYRCDLLSIDPYPPDYLAGESKSAYRQMASLVQDVPLETFDSLRENDMLFIDSSHVSCIGSDVNYEILQVLPRLAPGVLVHVHDIFIPAEYPRDWVVKHNRFWNEQYVLQAFLAFNTAFEILWAGYWMHLRCKEQLVSRIPSYDPADVSPGSIWLRRTG